MLTNSLKKITSKIPLIITNGVLLIIIGVLHSSTVVSSENRKQFIEASHSYFFKIGGGMSELPIESGKMNLEMMTFFWFFYFGLLLIPLGLLVHSIETKNRILPYSFTISYLIFVLIGSYMIPDSGMTVIMLPQAVYMLTINHIRKRRKVVNG